MYVGAANLPHDDGYGAKVVGEYRGMQAVAGGKNVSAYATTAKISTPAPKPAISDKNSDKDNIASLVPAVQLATL